MHGYGASKEDLAGLLPYVEKVRVLTGVPDAPLTIPIPPMMGEELVSDFCEARRLLRRRDAVPQNLVPDGKEAVDHKAIVKELM